MCNEKYATWPIFMAESPKYLHLIGNLGRQTRWLRQIFLPVVALLILLDVIITIMKSVQCSVLCLYHHLRNGGRYRVAQNKPVYLRLLPKFCISTTKHVSLIMYM